jgi:hypothetical protein
VASAAEPPIDRAAASVRADHLGAVRTRLSDLHVRRRHLLEHALDLRQRELRRFGDGARVVLPPMLLSCRTTS